MITKNILISGLLAFQSLSMLLAQEKTKPDTMSIILNGEHITLPVPREGNKTTINFEDSTGIIQISVGKISKLKAQAPTAPTPRESSGKNRDKRISWFNEVDFALTAMAIQRTSYDMADTGYSYGFSLGSSITTVNNNRATMLTLTPKRVYPGFSAGFTIREKSRPISGSKRFYFVTGSRFRYTRFSGKGEYDIREIKSTTVNGVVTYYPDTVYSVSKGEYRTTNNSFTLLFPFVVGTQLKEGGKMHLEAGVNLGINVNSSKISQNIKENYSLISYVNPQVIQLQPIIKASFNRTSFFFTFNVSKTRIGYGATQKLEGNRLFFGMAFKLY
jgi:hypothetical protein